MLQLRQLRPQNFLFSVSPRLVGTSNHQSPTCHDPDCGYNASELMLLDEDLHDITEPRPTKNVYFRKVAKGNHYCSHRFRASLRVGKVISCTLLSKMDTDEVGFSWDQEDSVK